MNAIPPAVVWLAGLSAAIAAIHLTIAWRDEPPGEAGFDRPLARSLAAALGWADLVMVWALAVSLSGLVGPSLAGAAIWAAMTLIRRSLRLTPLRGLALPLALSGLVCALLLFQAVFGERDFGLIDVFADR